MRFEIALIATLAAALVAGIFGAFYSDEQEYTKMDNGCVLEVIDTREVWFNSTRSTRILCPTN